MADPTHNPTPATSVPLDPNQAKLDERLENLPPQPEPRIEDPASTVSVNTATSFGGTTPLGPGGQRTMKQAIDLARRAEKERKRAKKEDEIFINLGSPLNVKTKHGELQAGPGDVVRRVAGHHIIYTQDQYEEVGATAQQSLSYDELLRKTLKRGVIARRLDDGNRTPMTAEQEAEADKNIEEEVKNHREAREVLKKHKEKMAALFEIDPENPQAWNAVDSGEGPPTATPSDTATLVPNYIPIEVLDAGEEEGPEPHPTANPNPTAVKSEPPKTEPPKPAPPKVPGR
jgi:hypothetical protein